jgi:hypothetical protein
MVVVVVADIDVSGAVVSGMAEEVGAQVLFFIRSSSGLSKKFSGKSRPLIHYPIFIHNKEENIEDYLVSANGYHTHMHAMNIFMSDICYHLPSPATAVRNACWHFSASLLRTGLGPIPVNGARSAMLAIS